MSRRSSRKLAAEIRDAQAREIRSLRPALDHAVRCGQLLLQAKKIAGHGNWETWLEKNVPFSPRSAREYMQLAEIPAAKRRRIADLGIHGLRDVLAYIAEKRPDEVATTPPRIVTVQGVTETHRITSVMYHRQPDPTVETLKPIYEAPAQTEEVAAPAPLLTYDDASQNAKCGESVEERLDLAARPLRELRDLAPRPLRELFELIARGPATEHGVFFLGLQQRLAEMDAGFDGTHH